MVFASGVHELRFPRIDRHLALYSVFHEPSAKYFREKAANGSWERPILSLLLIKYLLIYFNGNIVTVFLEEDGGGKNYFRCFRKAIRCPDVCGWKFTFSAPIPKLGVRRAAHVMLPAWFCFFTSTSWLPDNIFLSAEYDGSAFYRRLQCKRETTN